MKILMFSVLFLATTAQAHHIQCNGRTTEVQINLKLSNSFAPLTYADFIFKKKKVETAGFEFSVNTNKEQQYQTLTYKFKNLKRFPKTKKGSVLALSIYQLGVPENDREFKLNEQHEAQLRLEENGASQVLDTLNCKALN